MGETVDYEARIQELKRSTERGHPRPLLPGGRNPGRRRLRRRQPPAGAGGGEDEGRRHRLLRRPLHGRDGEDPEPAQAGAAARPEGRLLAVGRCPPDRVQGASREAPRTRSWSPTSTSSAAVKAMSDVICTSSNAEKIVDRMPEGPADPLRARPAPRPLPDEADRPRHGALAGQLHGPRDLQREEARRSSRCEHPDAEVIAHPECEERVLAARGLHRLHQGACSSTRSKSADAGVHRGDRGRHPPPDAEAAPEKTFIPAPPDNGCACNECPHMRLNTLEKLYLCMRDRTPELILPADSRRRRSLRCSGCSSGLEAERATSRDCRRAITCSPLAPASPSAMEAPVGFRFFAVPGHHWSRSRLGADRRGARGA